MHTWPSGDTREQRDTIATPIIRILALSVLCARAPAREAYRRVTQMEVRAPRVVRAHGLWRRDAVPRNAEEELSWPTFLYQDRATIPN